jgi:ferrochelatase
MTTIGIILLNLGGPDSLQAIKPFLFNLFSDRQIIRLGPPFMQKPLAWLISATRSKKTSLMYQQIGGKSPILEITNAQGKALKEKLNQNRSGHVFEIYTGMRYWHPFIDDVVPAMYKEGIRKIIALSLYPQYSLATAGSSITKFEEIVGQFDIEHSCISSWHDHPLYIAALVDVIQKGLESFVQKLNPSLPPSSHGVMERLMNSELNIHVLFSAHSLPQKMIDDGDPYLSQTQETIKEVAKRLPIQWHLSFQSKSGPVKWLEPSTEEKMRELAASGVKHLLTVPISFVSDHIETLYEIDILYKSIAEELGLNMKRAESLNTNPVFIEALRDILQSAVSQTLQT